MRKLFQTQCLSSSGVFLLICTLLCISCGNDSYLSPKGYHINKPVKSELGKDLNEVSGLSFNIDDTSILAISDSKRKVYQLDLRRMKLKDYSEKIYTQSDFEDIVKLDTTVFVLISNGTILSMPLRVKDTTRTVAFPFWSTEKNDFESMYYDASKKSLIIICKSCEADKGQQVRSAYRFNLDTKTFDSSAFYTISSDEVKSNLKKDDAEFKPSAAAIHPLENRLYILSSAGQLLVIADTNGKVEEVYNLNPDLYPQAEGITFAPNGTMYISNEGKYGSPTLLMFPYKLKPASRKKK
ncbi:MAG TPA: SdiA-regulated domain-containing protein [Flavisolibacter sp.]|nr:SdiA-regulated domain-containing protein [Flavisolibacter sp.]